ncbi:hypothetical protein ACLVWU_04665 [Bdellovibrio sp. HCB290]|uniref:hypothetical protein n=1 Tax=Bdellovibrio sp. HCB290 TaxID=3394356 RepID=UPI0039B4C9DF
MKALVGIFAMVLMAGSTAFAHADKSSENKSDAVTVITGKDKNVRKKKVHMCGECGKPEAECECPGHKNDLEKKAKEQSDK